METDKRAAILEAAIEAIAAHGFHGAPMAQIASRAGVGAGTIYRYFADKDALILAAFELVLERMLAAAVEGYPSGQAVRARFLHLGGVLVRYCIQNPLEFKYLTQFHDSPYGLVISRELLAAGNLAVDLFEEGRRQQVVKDLPLPVLFALAFEPLLKVSRDILNHLLERDETLILRTCEACWDALRL